MSLLIRIEDRLIGRKKCTLEQQNGAVIGGIYIFIALDRLTEHEVKLRDPVRAQQVTNVLADPYKCLGRLLFFAVEMQDHVCRMLHRVQLTHVVTG